MRTHRDAEGGARTGTGAQHRDLLPPVSAAGSRNASPCCAPRVAGDGRSAFSHRAAETQDTPSPELSLGPAQECHLAVLPV